MQVRTRGIQEEHVYLQVAYVETKTTTTNDAERRRHVRKYLMTVQYYYYMLHCTYIHSARTDN